MIESVSKSEVEFIDYRFGVDITNRLKKPQSKAESIVDKILKNRTPWNYLKKKNFFKEIERNLILDLKNIGVDKLNYDCEVDTLVIGSDEVFNCLQPYPVGYSKQLFGDGYAHSKIVSYAASFGSTRYEDLVDTGIAHEIKTMLSRFAAISVRDENSAHIVRQLLGYSPEIHMDPVLMYDFTQEIAEYTTYERDYIILYAYTGRLSREEENYIKKFAKRHNKRIICVGHYSNIADKNIICNPLYVFSYFKNADYVITDTFHGTVFSIKMNTKFCTLVRDSNRNKLEALLNKLDKLDRKVEKLEDIERLYNTEVDFYKTNQIIEQERKNNMLYLKEIFKMGSESRNRYLLKNTLIFTLGNIGSRMISFFLIPLYTNVLTTSQYGTVDLITTISTVAGPMLTLNIAESVMRFGLDKDADKEKTHSVEA